MQGCFFVFVFVFFLLLFYTLAPRYTRIIDLYWNHWYGKKLYISNMKIGILFYVNNSNNMHWWIFLKINIKLNTSWKVLNLFCKMSLQVLPDVLQSICVQQTKKHVCWEYIYLCNISANLQSVTILLTDISNAFNGMNITIKIIMKKNPVPRLRNEINWKTKY